MLKAEACTGDPEDPLRLPIVQKEQHRAEGKVGKAISRPPTHASEDETYDDKMPSDDDEVKLGDEHVPSLSSKTINTK